MREGWFVFFPAVAHLLGSVTAAVFLADLMRWEGKQHDPDRWIYKTAQDIYLETGLTSHEQRTARQILRAAEIVEEKYAGLPRKLYFRINSETLDTAWIAFVHEREQSDGYQDKKPQGNPHNAVFRKAIKPKTDKQASGKTASNSAGKQPATTTTNTTIDHNNRDDHERPVVDDDQIVESGLCGLATIYPVADIVDAVEIAKRQYPPSKIKNLPGLVRTIIDSGGVSAERVARQARRCKEAEQQAVVDARQAAAARAAAAKAAIDSAARQAWDTLTDDERAAWAAPFRAGGGCLPDEAIMTMAFGRFAAAQK
jgi:hypothetical protein